MSSEKINVHNVEYEIFSFKYFDGYMNDEYFFVLLDENYAGNKKCKIGKLHIIIPSWFEMQDIYDRSSEYNMLTKKYEIEEEKLKLNKMKRLFFKIVDDDGSTTFPNKEFLNNLCPWLFVFILNKTEDVISKYYYGSGLSDEEEKESSYRLFKYFSAIEKRKRGKDVVLPPCPGIVLLLDICEIFNCKPDAARKISKKDIDMIMIAKEQENICSNHPEMIGLE